MSTKREILVFGGSASKTLTARICRHLHIRPGACETKQFSEGNTFVRVLENVRGRDVYLVQSLGFPVNDRFVETLFYIDALKRASAESVTAVIPFFSYGKGDKKDEPRVSLRARVCADCLEASGVDRVVTIDLHAPQIQGFFKVPLDHLYALRVFAAHLRKRVARDWVVVAPDAGAIQIANQYARALSVPTAVAEKRRRGHSETAKVQRIIGDVDGKNALIVDDFTTSGATLVATAERLKAAGAKRVCAAVSHGVLATGAAARLDHSPIDELLITDTVEYRFEPLPKIVKIVSVAKLLAQAIRNIHHRTSVSVLFGF
jgi:ribose-phosphate pyrophosphokinase